MSEFKRQHYVPVFYMKNFSNNGKSISVFHIDNDRIIENASIKRQCQSNYFYGDDLELEHRYQIAETEWSKAIRKALQDEPLDDFDKFVIKGFALFQRNRTKITASYRKEQNKQMAGEWCKSIALSRGIDPEKHEDLIESFAETKANEITTAADILAIANDIKPYMSDLDVGIIRYNTKAKLISSDTPVIMKNPLYGFQGDGIGLMGIVLFFPIDSERLIYIYDSLIYGKANTSIINSDNEEEVKVLNTYQYASAENIIYSDLAEHFQDLMPEKVSARERTKNQSIVSSLGSGVEKLVATTERSIRYDASLSFCTVPRVFRRIPTECKEPFPRFCNKETKSILIAKRNAMINMYDLLRNKGFYGNLSKKEYSRGSKDYFRQADIYWAKHKELFGKEEELVETLEIARENDAEDINLD